MELATPYIASIKYNLLKEDDLCFPLGTLRASDLALQTFDLKYVCHLEIQSLYVIERPRVAQYKLKWIYK